MANKDNLLGVLRTLFHYRRGILSATLITALGSGIISWVFLDNYYKATTTFYPLSSDVFKPEQMFGLSTKDMDYYGTESDVDRLLTIAHSNEIYEFLIKKYNLYQHYKIDTSSERAASKVKEALDGLYEVKKTKNNAIEVSVEDKDRRLAAEMSNAARDKIDEIAQRLVREIQANLLRGYETSFLEKGKLMKGFGDTLSILRQNYGVIDPEHQTEAVTKSAVEAEGNYYRSKARLEALRNTPSVSRDTIALLEATVKGDEEGFKRSGELMKRYNQGFNSVSVLKEYYEQERNQFGRDKQRYLQLKIAYQTQIQALKTVETAIIPIEKSRPKRSILVISATLVVFVLMILAALLADNYRNIDWKEVIADDRDAPQKDKKRQEVLHQ